LSSRRRTVRDRVIAPVGVMHSPPGPQRAGGFVSLVVGWTRPMPPDGKPSDLNDILTKEGLGAALDWLQNEVEFVREPAASTP
jgi:hypothetical protein